MVGERRLKFDAVTLAIAGATGLLVGGTISWFAFGAPRGIDLVADSGSTADWVAAISTGVVGAAAAFVAWRQGHISELHRLEADERVRAGVQAKLIQISQLPELIPVLSVSEAGVIASKARMRAVQQLLAKCELESDEIRVLNRDAMRRNVDLRISTEVALMAIDTALERTKWLGNEEGSVRAAMVDVGAIAVAIWAGIASGRDEMKPSESN